MAGDPTPIPPFAEDALAALEAARDDSTGLKERTALQTLENEGFSTADAEAALEILEMRGYLYRVDDELRITD
jgi:hypothetical protein